MTATATKKKKGSRGAKESGEILQHSNSAMLRFTFWFLGTVITYPLVVAGVLLALAFAWSYFIFVLHSTIAMTIRVVVAFSGSSVLVAMSVMIWKWSFILTDMYEEFKKGNGDNVKSFMRVGAAAFVSSVAVFGLAIAFVIWAFDFSYPDGYAAQSADVPDVRVSPIDHFRNIMNSKPFANDTAVYDSAAVAK